MGIDRPMMMIDITRAIGKVSGIVTERRKIYKIKEMMIVIMRTHVISARGTQSLH